jgi:hypothetical protein
MYLIVFPWNRLLVAITAIPAIRRRIYKIFYLVHVLGYLSLFAGGIYHEKALRPVSPMIYMNRGQFELINLIKHFST